MITTVKYTYENAQVIKHVVYNVAKNYSKMVNVIYEEACKFIDERWVYMTKKVVYDNEIVGCIPNTEYYNCSVGNFDIAEANFAGLKWDYFTLGELKKAFDKNVNFPFYNDANGYRYFYYNKNKSIYRTWTYVDNNGDYAHWSNCDDSTEFGKTCNVPIARLSNKDSKMLSKEQVFLLWLRYGLVPELSHYSEEYEKILAFYRYYPITFVGGKFILDTDKLYNDVIQDIRILNNFPDILRQCFEESDRAYLECDKERIDLNTYDEKILTDPNRGHWEIRFEPGEHCKYKFDRDTPMVYRNPIKDVKDGGVVGIDFGTKSTIVVYQDDSTDIIPMRVGTGNLKATVKESQFENPTVMEFVNIDKFLYDYKEQIGRPKTKWDDITISHTAFNSLLNSNSEQYSAYFNDLKQWCGNKDKRIRLRDKSDKIVDLPTFMELGEDDFNPIEIYAYYLGLYINNMNNGIYLEYLLSFPVTYEKNIRDKVIKSFTKGLKQSLPNEILSDEECMDKFNVSVGLSEPAGYALSALKEYGLEPDGGKHIFYGVFDFGGGTTDFDFGIYREATRKIDKARHHYAIEHFGAQGDRYLGGENLLELLAFEVFKRNEAILREKNISFILPPECKKFIGSEALLSESQEARRNTRNLMERLRPLWERHENYEEVYNKGIVNINLYNNIGDMVTGVELIIDREYIEKVLTDRIERGVKNFCEALKTAFENARFKELESSIDKINIFLSGNSSKSIIVKELFAQHIENDVELKESDKEVEIFPPLGTEEAAQKMEEHNLDYDQGNMKRPTGKTGVAFGIIMGRKSGKINIINHNNEVTGETKFRYYVGDVDRKNNFEPMLSPYSNYEDWIKFIDASEKVFEMYYTTTPEASTNTLKIAETTKLRVRLENEYDDDNIDVYVRPISPSAIEYMVASVEGTVLTTLEAPKQIQLT
ncbi:MAG: hypothetical protein ATN36_05000 [Epulopiscium sp. Nele67-Bin005]|nr:MAG: hypothetical protein ATN36_05000 [Epulopiscium sp. Nele67-Bin005]